MFYSGTDTVGGRRVMCHALDGRDDKVLEPEPVGFPGVVPNVLSTEPFTLVSSAALVHQTNATARCAYPLRIRSTCLLAYLPAESVSVETVRRRVKLSATAALEGLACTLCVSQRPFVQPCHQIP